MFRDSVPLHKITREDYVDLSESFTKRSDKSTQFSLQLLILDSSRLLHCFKYNFDNYLCGKLIFQIKDYLPYVAPDE